MKSLLLALLSMVLIAGAARTEKLVIGFEELDFYPYGKTNEEGVFVGYLPAILETFAQDHGYELEFTVIPLKRLFLGFKGGGIDMFAPDNPAWSQSYKEGIDIFYSDTIAIALDGFAVLPGRENETIDDRIHHIGAILGFTIEPLFDPAELERVEFDRASRFESLFRALLLERVDSVYCNLAAANHVLGNIGHGPRSIVWNRKLPRFKSRFQVSSTRAELIEELNRWLRANGATVTALKEEYGILAGETLPWGGE